MRVLIAVFWAACPRPFQATSDAFILKTGSCKTCSRLTLQDVCDYFFIAHRLCCSGGCGIEHTTGIMCSISAEAVNLQRMAIVQHPANRSAANSYANQFFIVHDADGKLVPDSRLVMSVVGGNKLICGSECYWCQFHCSSPHFFSSHFLLIQQYKMNAPTKQPMLKKKALAAAAWITASAITASPSCPGSRPSRSA